MTIKYFGYYKKKAGKAEESYVAQRSISDMMTELTKYLKREYDILPPFALLVDGEHILSAQKKQMILDGGEVIKIIPHISGG